MADGQLALGRAMDDFVDQLAQNSHSVQVMVTTTDMDNFLCSPFHKPDYTPALGSPIASGCNARVNRFTGIGANPEERFEVCTELCPADVVPTDPFIAFDTMTLETNIEGAQNLSAAKAALACVLPQGIDGCGYESPLEAMLQALNPNASWNAGDRPFLRDDAALAIVVLSDEADCSLAEPTALLDQAYQELDPATGTPAPSSAVCWNAGIVCSPPDGDGVHGACMSTPEGPLQPVSRYVEFLADVRNAGKHVTMLALTGVPIVIDYADTAPFEPVAGGLADLVYRQWRPEDLTADELDQGITAEDMRFSFGIGPGCPDPEAASPGFRALPSPRLVEVCQSLDVDGQVGCCVDSFCGDYRLATQCLLAAATPG